MRYVDGFVLPVPKKNLAAYRRMAQKAGKIWRTYGALDYKECAGDDLNVKMGVPFPRLTRLKRGETMCDPKSMPFDVKRMVYGGFKVLGGSLTRPLP